MQTGCGSSSGSSITYGADGTAPDGGGFLVIGQNVDTAGIIREGTSIVSYARNLSWIGE
jgi:hypothetical protein